MARLLLVVATLTLAVASTCATPTGHHAPDAHARRDVAEGAHQVPIRGPDPPCSTFTTCGVCAQNSGCNWCAQSQTCHSTSYTGCSCSGTCGATTCFGKVCAARYGQCSNYLSCGTCTTDPACGWNVYAQACVRGDAAGACWTSNNQGCSGSGGAIPQSYWQYGTTAVCPAKNSNCGQHLSCAACTADLACGWNVYGQACVAGNAAGACWSSQDSSCSGSAGVNSTFYWQYGPSAICPQRQGTCAQYLSCSACAEDAACGWNVEMQICAPGNADGACWSSQDSSCTGGASVQKSYYWQYGSQASCPKFQARCSQYVDCMSCAADSACGWNIELQLCTMGNANGACWSSHDSVCTGPAAVPKGYHWQHGARAVCPSIHRTCPEFTSCSSCVANNACGWNGNSCVPGNVHGACKSSNTGSSWSFGKCS